MLPMLTVAAAGNSALDNDMLLSDGSNDPFPDSPFFPASYTLPRLMSVTASTDDDQYGFSTGCDADASTPRWPCGFANWGHDSVDLAAPGVDILSSVPSLGPAVNYQTFNGTSMATAFASGAAGLLKSAHPAWTPGRIKNVLMNESARPASLDRVWSFLFQGLKRGRVTRTDGRLDAAEALAPNPNTATATPVTDGNVHSRLRVLETGVWGRVSWPTDVNDVYKKKLFSGVKYRAFLDVPKGANFDLWIWRPGTVEIWQLQPGCYGMGGACKLDRFSNLAGSADETLVFNVGTTGNYFFHVTSNFSSGGYHLVVKRV
jgi:subtilisin family serine protease